MARATALKRKVFADSSIIIAGTASRTGASRAVLTMAELGLFKLVVSEQVLEECQRNKYVLEDKTEIMKLTTDVLTVTVPHQVLSQIKIPGR